MVYRLRIKNMQLGLVLAKRIEHLYRITMPFTNMEWKVRLGTFKTRQQFNNESLYKTLNNKC